MRWNKIKLDDLKTIKKLFKQGETISEIARWFNVDRTVIYYWLKRIRLGNNMVKNKTEKGDKKNYVPVKQYKDYLEEEKKRNEKSDPIEKAKKSYPQLTLTK